MKSNISEIEADLLSDIGAFFSSTSDQLYAYFALMFIPVTLSYLSLFAFLFQIVIFPQSNSLLAIQIWTLFVLFSHVFFAYFLYILIMKSYQMVKNTVTFDYGEEDGRYMILDDGLNEVRGVQKDVARLFSTLFGSVVILMLWSGIWLFVNPSNLISGIQDILESHSQQSNEILDAINSLVRVNLDSILEFLGIEGVIALLAGLPFAYGLYLFLASSRILVIHSRRTDYDNHSTPDSLKDEMVDFFYIISFAIKRVVEERAYYGFSALIRQLLFAIIITVAFSLHSFLLISLILL